MKLGWPASGTGSLLAGLATWVSLWAWSGFVETPSGYLIPALGACLIVAVSGMLMRSARIPGVLVVLAQLVILLVWVNRMWAMEPMLGGWLPTPASLSRVGARLDEAVRVSQAFAAPVPESAPEIYAILVVAAAGTAVVVDFLANGLRRVPLAGLPLLTVYTAPLSILDEGVSWWRFAAGALAFLFLLANDEASRLSGWGRQLSGKGATFDSLGTHVNTSSVRASARKIGFTATGLAVLVPILIPTLGTNLFAGDGAGSGGDGDAVAISNPIVDLQRDLKRGDDVDLLEVDTADADPSYMRISVLDLFDGSTWKPSGRDIPVAQRADGPLPPPPGLDPRVPRSRLAYSIQASDDFESRWLPTPYPAAQVEADGDWRYDLGTLDIVSAAEGQTTSGLEYTVEGLRIRPDTRDLVNAPPVAEELFTRYTQLPEGVPGSLTARARRVAGSQTSRFEQAIRLQEWFRTEGGFRYSLDRAPGNGIEELTNFLSKNPGGRVGYCEQFAAAMALMGRSIGIPSRVAVGFLRPSRVDSDTYVFSAHDLHAWPEMYFEGTGWIRFEPTPADRASSVPGYTDLGSDNEQSGGGQNTQNPRQEDSRFGQQEGVAPDAAAPAETEAGGGRGGAWAAWWVLAPLLLVGAVLPRFARTALRRRRWAGATTPAALAEAAWTELRDSAIDLRLPWDDTVTLRARARALVYSFGDPEATVEERLSGMAATGPDANLAATAALERLVRFVERARYARTVYAPAGDVAADVSLCVQALRDHLTRKHIFLATWLPVSLVRTIAAEVDRRARSRRQVAVVTEPGVDHAI